ncbi:MAG: serine/threonine-protein kinase, partial [Planctomycetota bacterium]
MRLLEEPVTSSAALEQIAGFRLLEVLGRGGMGVVYRAVDAELGREVALKVLRPELLHFADSRQRFQREIESASRLRHPGIVSVYTAGEDDGVPFFTMELVEGASLAGSIELLQGQTLGSRRGIDLLASDGDRGSSSQSGTANLADNWIRACLQVARMVAEALQHAHENGVIHRDVKPSNILIDEHGRARLLDFGLARLESGQQLTKSTSLLGSLPYMPPELVEARLTEPGPRQDVYSLAVTLYELLTLRQPFLADGSEETRRRVLAGEFVGLRRMESSIGRECEIVCHKAMDLDPSRRYASAREFADDLDNLLEHRPIQARPAGMALRSWRLLQRHPTGSVSVILGMLVVIASVFALVSTMQSREIERQAMRQLVDSNLDFVFQFAQGLQSMPGNTELRVKLLRQATDQLLQLENNPDLDPARLGKIGEAHIALAEVLGRPNKTNIGSRGIAEERYQHVLEELVPRLTMENEAGAALLRSRAALGLAAIFRFGGEYDAAIEVLDTAA